MASGFEIFPEVSGALAERGPADLIALIEEKRITGVLEAHDGPNRFELVLCGGQIEKVEASESSEDPLSSFLDLEKGRYRLRQQLLLPDGTLSDQRVVTGTIEEHAPIDLVRTCERGGLHGTLRIKCGGRLVEALFNAGLLTTITLDGHQDVDVNDVWSWTSGEWAILALPALEPAPDPTDSGMEFLREFEVAAVDFLSDAQQKTDAKWALESSREINLDASARVDEPRSPAGESATSPEMAEGSSQLITPTTEARQKRPDERTVRIIYYDTAKPSDDPTPIPSRYADADVTSVFIYKRPKQKIIVENSSSRGRDQGRFAGEIVSLAEMSGKNESSNDPIELAFAPSGKQANTPLVSRPAPVKQRRSPFLTIVVTLVLLSFIGVLLYFISMMLGMSG